MRKKKIAFAIGLFLLPIVKPIFIGTNSALLFFATEKAQANNAYTYFDIGLKKAKSRNCLGAISDFNKAIEINPNYLEAFYNRGLCKQLLEDYDQAIIDFNKAIEINPNYERIHYIYNNRGIVRRRTGDMKGACSDWRKASALGSANAKMTLAIKKSKNQC